MQNHRTAKPALPTLEPRIPSALKKKLTTANAKDRKKRKQMAAVLTPLLAALQESTGREL